MQIQVQGVIRSGNPALDTGITDLVVYVGSAGVQLYASSGRNGGVSSYRIGNDATVTHQSGSLFPQSITGTVSDRLILDTSGAQPRIYIGSDAGGLIAYDIRGDLSIGGRLAVGWNSARELARNGEGEATLEALITMSARGTDLLPPGWRTDQAVSLRTVTVQDRDYVVIACAETHSVTTFHRDPRTGALIPADQQGALQGLGIHAPTAMEVVTIGNSTYVVLASAGTSSISVMRIEADGRLRPTDHLIDTDATRFAGAQALSVAQSGSHTFVVVGGADHGVSLFLLMGDGRLVWLDTVIDSAALSMHNVSAITTVIHNGVLHIFVGSQTEAGITHLTVSVDNLGNARGGVRDQVRRVEGTPGDDILTARGDGDTLLGGAGDDVLVSGPGRTVMTGGAGADIFVIRAESRQVQITDYQRGVDRLDLTDLPMLRDLSQLVFRTTSDGARIEYRGVTIILRSADRQPLTLDDLFPDGLPGGDRVPLLVRRDSPQPGRDIFGTGGNDRITGTMDNDTIWGMRGNDFIRLIGGNDAVYAGPGNDTVIGASTGNATIYGGEGDDLLYAVGGNNWVGGGPGNDTIYGGSGNDKLWGAEGNDLIHTGGGRNEAWGGDGNDTIHGGDGGNLMGGGQGDDVIYGGTGNDTIWGAPGNDLIYGTAGRNEIWGGPGNDTIHGGTGNDILGGGPGNDLIYGGAGNDTIYGGEGNDTLWGGRGADVFVFYRNQDINRIMDFNPAEGDMLHLARWLWGNLGNLTPAQVVARFGSVDANGNIVLDFGPHGGTTIILVGFDDLDALIAQIEIL